MLNEIYALNSGSFKGDGAFGLQDDTTLNIDTFDNMPEFKDNPEAADAAFDQALRVQRIGNLSNANSSGLSGLKFGWVANSLAEPENLKNNITAVLQEIEKGKNPNATNDEKRASAMAEASLEASFKTVRGALDNPDTLADMRDREKPLRAIEAALAKLYGVAPLDSEKLEIKFDSDAFAKSPLPKPSTEDSDLADAIDDSDDSFSPPTPEQQ